MVSGPLTDGWYVSRAQNGADTMLIVCPNCGTSYMVDPAALGSSGRTVRCARCKTTWFAGWQKTAAPDLNAFVDGVIAEAEAQSSSAPAQPARPESPAASLPPAADDFGSEPAEPTTAEPEAASAPTEAAGEEDHAGAPAEAPVAMEEEAPSLVPPLEHEPLPGAETAESDSDDIESYAARRQRLQSRRKQARRSSRQSFSTRSWMIGLVSCAFLTVSALRASVLSIDSILFPLMFFASGAATS